jgi:predicted DNA-binding antitoxin AbrB/MazE fold protein
VSKQLIEAVFENGILRPLTEICPRIPEGQRVRLVIETEEPLAQNLELATRVYDELTEHEIDEIQSIALHRGHFFVPRTTR